MSAVATTPAHRRPNARRKVLVPLGTLLVASALVAGSGATFTSTSANTTSAFTTGTLTQSNSKAGQAIFDLDNLKPGDTLNGTLTITNTGSLPAAFSLTETSSSNAFSADLLTLRITNTTTGTTVYDGTFGGLVDGAQNELGTYAAGDANTYQFTVTLDAAAGNSEQGKSATATYQWDSVQLDPTTYNQ
jgi:spore coat-associated protein N